MRSPHSRKPQSRSSCISRRPRPFLASFSAPAITIRVIDDTGNLVLSIASDTTNTHVLALANPIGFVTKLTDTNRVVLARDGDTYRIDKLWVGAQGYEILNAAKR